jgi:hypothetical protein
MGRMVGIFLDFVSENYLGFLMVGIVLCSLLYLMIGMIGKASGLFWSFVLEGVLSVSILVILSFVWVYLAIGF